MEELEGGSRALINKELIGVINKDLEKLKRQSENMELKRKVQASGGSYREKSEEELEEEARLTLQRDLTHVNAHIVHASPQRMQLMRHQASHLGSTAQLSLEELEAERLRNKERLHQLEAMYLSQKSGNAQSHRSSERPLFGRKKSVKFDDE